MKYKVYLASGFNRRYDLRVLGTKLAEAGHDVTSSWILLDERPARTRMTWSVFAAKIAETNFADLERSNCLIIDAYGIRPDNKGGVHTEFGYALKAGWPIYLIGRRGNTFHYLPHVTIANDYDHVVQLLSS